MNAMRRAFPLIALALLALPASASAVDITVNSTGDTAANDGTCTLREAIVAANTNTTSGAMTGECAAGMTSDAIKFSAAFDGQVADSTIAFGSAPASIASDTDIVGGSCTTDAGVAGPCVGVNGPTGGFGLTVDFDGVSISGIAATGALTGINVINASTGFAATNDWLGVKLDGTAGANNTGLFIDPDSNGATIGGTTAAARNVFADNNNNGLDIEGADDAVVSGNYFGVAPNGTTTPTNNTPTQIEITGSTAGGGFAATGNVVGGTPNLVEAASQACDGPCNVVANATDGSSGGIDLRGNGAGQNEMPAGQTSIRGNYVGFDATGAGQPGNFNAGIVFGGADQVTVGGPLASDGNRITGGSTGVSADVGDDMTIQNNVIGLNLAQTAMSTDPPSTFGILAVVPAGEQATIAGNRIARPTVVPTGTIAIQNNLTGVANVTGNDIGQGIGGQTLPGGGTGIQLFAGDGGHVVDGNLIHNVGANAISIEDSSLNVITGNDIDGSGAAGISIVDGSNSNTVGGDAPADANLITNADGDAVEVADDAGDGNEILQNLGSGNADLFIDLGADGLGNDTLTGPNAGIQAPVIASAAATSASGTADPGATVRVFRKTSPANGEINGFLGMATADGSGNWTVTYSSLPDATNIGATQTAATAGTSEMTVGQTPPATGGGGGGGGGTVTPGPTGERAAAIKRCKKKFKGKAKAKKRKKCIKRAKRLPV
jgi:CSLREA domain-containing protein